MLSTKLHGKRLRIDVWIDVQMNNFWNTQSNFTLISLITFEVLNQTSSNLQETCRNSSRCCPVSHVNLQAPSAGITATSLKSGAVWLSTSKVINKISVKFDWICLKVIHFDVNSDVNSQPFSMQICRHHRLVLRQLPC